MPHLTLVMADTPSAQPAATRPTPTSEFLARRILAFQLGSERIGALLAEVDTVLRNDGPNTLRRSSDITDVLSLAGIWLCPQESDDAPPMHGLVAYPAKLVKLFPELERVQSELDGLQLMLPSA